MQADDIDHELLNKAVAFARLVDLDALRADASPEAMLLREKLAAVKAFLQHCREYAQLWVLAQNAQGEVKADTDKVLDMVKRDMQRAAERLLFLDQPSAPASQTMN